MKIISIILILVLSFGAKLIAQECLPEGITFTEQEQIDNFQYDYPNCSEIEGNLLIAGEDITNLFGLNVINVIQGNLEIGDFIMEGNPNLQNLNGFEGLTSIGGNLSIYANGSLLTINGLDNLSSVNGNLAIRYNSTLQDISALYNIDESSIASLGIVGNESLADCNVGNICNYLSDPNGAVSITLNAIGCNNPPEVAAACGFTLQCLPYGNYLFSEQNEINSFQTDYPNCTELKGRVGIAGPNIYDLSELSNVISIEGGLDIYNNLMLNNLTGLNELEYIGGDFEINGNHSFTDLSGLENLNIIGGRLDISHCDSLINFTGLNNLYSIAGDMYIEWNDTLYNLNGLDNLNSVGGKIHLRSNNNLSYITGLNNLEYIGESLLIGNNKYLESLSGLDNVNSIEGNLEIFNNNSLTNLTGIEGIDSIGGYLDIARNNTLISLNGLNNVDRIGEYLNIYDNDSLTNLSGLDNIEMVGGVIWILNNDLLSNLSGLENISSINGGLWIYSNHNLTDLTGLSNLSKIGGEIKIYNNDSLTSLNGLDSIDSGTIDGLYITNNNSLTSCAILSICEYLISPNGEINIYENANGCNNQEEVEEDCLTGITILNKKTPQVCLYPNPATNELNISTIDNISIKELNIFNQFGQKIVSMKLSRKKIDISSLNSGIYFIELITNETRITKKLIVK